MRLNAVSTIMRVLVPAVLQSVLIVWMLRG
jgi:hypothetical protein